METTLFDLFLWTASGMFVGGWLFLISAYALHRLRTRMEK